jgi:hypothetical protein
MTNPSNRSAKGPQRGPFLPFLPSDSGESRSGSASPDREGRLRLKDSWGWFAAGAGFRKALTLLSDGAFKLFAHLSLEAGRTTGRIAATHKELAAALNKSKRSIGSHVAELQARAVCNVYPGKNQFASTVYEIADPYWPYHRTKSCSDAPEMDAYVQSVRECFEALGCVTAKFGAAGIQAARRLQQRAIPLAVIQDALLLGASRKYIAWLNGAPPEPIRSLAYFEPVIAEIQETPLPPGYSAYLRREIQQLAIQWHESTKSRQDIRLGFP